MALSCAYLAFTVLWALPAFPALHADEAWIGNYAQRIQESGVFSPHEMNTYTGPFYGWLVAKAFNLFGRTLTSLRAPGAVLNILAAWLMVWHLAKRVGSGSALTFAYLLASSPMFLMKSRVAWEVYALQNVLLAVLLTLGTGFAEGRRPGLAGITAFLLANYLGVMNHFIFISVPASLFLALAAYVWLYGGEDRGFLALAGWSLLMAVGVYLVKPRLTEAAWDSWRPWSIVAAAALPFAFSAACAASLDRTQDILVRSLRGRAGGSAFRKVLVCGILAFGVYHFVAMVRIWSGVVVFERLVSWKPPLALSVPLHAWAAALLAAYFLFAVRNHAKEKLLALAPAERLLVFWPLVYAAIFIVFRDFSTIRYYVIPSFMISAGLAVVLPKIQRPANPKVLAALACMGVAVNLCVWKELLRPQDRRPIRFLIGRRWETSWDFTRKDSVIAELDRQGICRLCQENGLIELPIFYLRGIPKVRCDDSKSATVRFCRECEEPPFFKIEVHGPACEGKR
ncbi:MAG: hypothetical protein WC728_01390 [Elusimicrobiota bacterium]